MEDIKTKSFVKMFDTATRNGISRETVLSSVNWFKQVFKKPLTKSDLPDAIIKNADSKNKKNKILPGNLYVFLYEAISKGLPYWDAMPMVIPFAEDGTHFWGINFHYAPPRWRAIIMDKLLSVLDSKMQPKAKAQALNREVLKLTQIPNLQPLIKCYLKSQVKSKFILIDHEQWNLAVFLPLARFQGAEERDVHKQFKRVKR